MEGKSKQNVSDGNGTCITIQGVPAGRLLEKYNMENEKRYCTKIFSKW